MYLVKERNYTVMTACVRRVNSIVDDVPSELLSKVYTLKYRGHSTCEVTFVFCFWQVCGTVCTSTFGPQDHLSISISKQKRI